MKNIAVLALSLFVLSVPAIADAPSAPAVPAISASVKIGDETKAFCTGFRVSGGYVVTAGHCVSGGGVSEVYRVELQNGAVVKAKVMTAADGMDPAALDDFAVLRILGAAPEGWREAELDCGEVPAVGTEVAYEGYPLILPALLRTTGHVAGFSTWDSLGPFPYIVTDVTIAPGASGGPLYANGKVVGIASAAPRENPNLSFFNPIGIVCAVLHRVPATV